MLNQYRGVTIGFIYKLIVLYDLSQYIVLQTSCEQLLWHQHHNQYLVQIHCEDW